MFFLHNRVRVGTVLALGLLAGCAVNGLDTRVNSFQDWPADGKGKAFVFINSDTDNLEQKSYADLIAAAMKANSLIQVQSSKKADYFVSFQTMSVQRERLEERYDDPPFLSPSLYLGNVGFGYYRWFTGIGIDYYPRAVTYRVSYHHYTLALTIQNKRGASLYQVMVSADSTEKTLPEVMPFLVNAAFDGFPNRNAKPRTIRFDLDKSIEHSTPIKVQSTH